MAHLHSRERYPNGVIMIFRENAAAVMAPGELHTNHPLRVTGLLDMIGASWMSQAICVAAELEIPDLLVSKPQTLQQLAVATQCASGALFRLLRALVSLGICVEESVDTFALTCV